MSESYGDFIVGYRTAGELADFSPEICIQDISSRFAAIYAEEELWRPLSYDSTPYEAIPKLYAPQNMKSLREAGITQVRRSVLGLTGAGVLIGILDTGIDYAHPAFLDPMGRTRIAAIWDQTIEDGPIPDFFMYGSEYRSEQINEALQNPDRRYEIVPSRDEDGHGTFLAGIAAGSPVNRAGDPLPLSDRYADEYAFIGAAPEAVIAAVRLKPAKQYLRDFFGLQENAQAYQENDIMLGAAYLQRLREELRMPLVILCGLGTNNGGHTGGERLAEMLSGLMNQPGVSGVVPAGNETGLAHHYRGVIPREGDTEDVEIRVAEGEKGFQLELWSGVPDRFLVSIASPRGVFLSPAAAAVGENQTIRFPLEQTTVDISYRFLESRGEGYLTVMRFVNPAPGVWTVRVQSLSYLTGEFHMWLPAADFCLPDTVFLDPDPNTTLTVPSAADNLLSVAGYDADTGGIEICSGRGFTRNGGIKPDLAAPGAGLYGPVPGGRFSTRSGTSGAAALAAGACACLQEWGIVRGNRIWINNNAVRSVLIQGAARDPGRTYPNREWGYGKLDLLRTVSELY